MRCTSKRSRASRARVTLVLILTVAFAVSAPASEGPFLTQLLAVSERVELALYFSKAALLASEAPAVAAYVAELRNLILGTDEPAKQTSALPEAVERLLEAADDVSLDDQARAELASSIGTILAYADRVAETAEALTQQGEDRASVLRTIHAYLAAMHGGIPFALTGLSDVLTSLPNAERTAVPGDDLQSEIDRLLPGGTLLLEAGTYTLSQGMIIDRSMTVRAAPGAAGAVELVIADDASTGISIYASDPVRVVIHDIIVRGGGAGLAVGEVGGIVSHAPSEVVLDHVSILDGRRYGLRVASGRVDLVDCVLAGHGEHGLVIPWSGSARLFRCSVERNGSEENVALSHRTSGGIDIAGVGAIELRSCHVVDNLGTGVRISDNASATLVASELAGNAEDGVLACGDATLHLERCIVGGNRGFGIRFASEACRVALEPAPTDPFAGHVTGSSNEISADNVRGAICPATYTFLSKAD